MSLALKTSVIPCPECGSHDVDCDGHRYLKDGQDVQRYICNSCGYRFSNGHISSRTNENIVRPNQLCAILEAKKLDSAQKIKICARDEKLPQDAAGLIAQFLAYLEKEGFSGETQYPNHIRRLVKNVLTCVIQRALKWLLVGRKSKTE